MEKWLVSVLERALSHYLEVHNTVITFDSSTWHSFIPILFFRVKHVFYVIDDFVNFLFKLISHSFFWQLVLVLDCHRPFFIGILLLFLSDLRVYELIKLLNLFITIKEILTEFVLE